MALNQRVITVFFCPLLLQCKSMREQNVVEDKLKYIRVLSEKYNNRQKQILKTIYHNHVKHTHLAYRFQFSHNTQSLQL